MPRYKSIVEYDGTKYNGWQVQQNLPTIQLAIEQAIYKIAKQKVRIYTAGRTDAGVHALGQVFHFDLDGKFEPFRLNASINHFLKNDDISLLNTHIIDGDFHARFDAKQRYYCYKIINRKAPLIIDRQKAWHVPWELDFDEMRKAKNVLLGTHDFSSFRDSQCQAKSPIKSIDNIELTKIGDEIRIEINALSFLHHMVRIIVGSLEHVGRNKWSIDDLQNALIAKKRSASGATAPACGLYFVRVDYDS